MFSIFPEYFSGPLDASLLGRARAAGLLDVRIHDPREHTTDRHHSVDDVPYGGGAGMVMTPEPLFAAVEATDPPRPLLLLGPAGRRFDQHFARTLAREPGFSMICGRYEGVDQRVADHLCDGELSVGDYVLAGGEAAALVIIDAVSRLVPGVMGNDASGVEESFGGDGSSGPGGLVEYPHYTRPADFRGHVVPDVLRTGDHARVARWRRAQSLRRTLAARPEWLADRALTEEEQALLREFPDPETGR